MIKHHSLDELVKLTRISRRAKYNFKVDLKRIKNFQNGKDATMFSKPAYDYMKYFILFDSQIQNPQQ